MGPREEDLARKARGGEMAYLRKVTRLSQLKAPLEASSLPSSQGSRGITGLGFIFLTPSPRFSGFGCPQ